MGNLTSRMAPRLAFIVVAVVFVGFLSNAFLYVLGDGATPVRVITALVGLGAMMVLQLGFFSNPRVELRSRTALVALAAEAALAYVPILYFGTAWTGMPGFLAGSALLVLRGPSRWIVFAAVPLSMGLLSYYQTGGVLLVFPYKVVVVALTGLQVYGLSRLRSFVAELERTRSERAELAVAAERLRFARDLHDLLGFSLSAITLKAELALRLIGGNTGQAHRELTEILGIARQALADVRAVASSYRRLSLDNEIATARSVLAAADVEVRLRAEPGELSPRVRTVLATVLREGVTNLLRHGDATWCEITVVNNGRRVSIDIRNDGVPDAREEGGSGIANLTTRVEAVGGSLEAHTETGSTFRLHAEMPPSGESDESTAEEAWPRRTSPAMAPRFAAMITTVMVAGYGINSLILTIFTDRGTASLAFAALFLVGAVALVIGFFSRPSAPVRSRRGLLALLTLAVLTFLPIVVLADPLVGLPGFVAGSALLVLPSRPGWAMFAAVVAGMTAAQVVLDGTPVGIGYGVVATVNHGLMLYAFTRLRSLVQELHEARAELAELAVTQERLRFARDLHDLLGYSLSAITLKSELAHRLVAREPDRAKAELTEIIDTSRQALDDVRSVARSYRALSLLEEAASARALLLAADIRVMMHLDRCELSPEVRTALATVLREGVTNLLRHSKAENCEITLKCTNDVVRMEVVNDGVTVSATDRDGGNGVGNLGDRMREVGGTLEAGTEFAGTYRLRAEVPLQRARPSPR